MNHKIWEFQILDDEREVLRQKNTISEGLWSNIIKVRVKLALVTYMSSYQIIRVV